jgi:hypothetical protein
VCGVSVNQKFYFSITDMYYIGLENREYGPRFTLYPQILSAASPTTGGRSVVVVRSLSMATEFVLF